jgi:30S ribosomal protein 3
MDDKPLKLKLKVAWFKNVLGIAIDQASLHQQYSLTPYYFWPRTEAWEQLKLELDTKLWLNPEEKISILKTAGEIMKYWLSYRNVKTVENFKQKFENMEIVVLHN